MAITDSENILQLLMSYNEHWQRARIDEDLLAFPRRSVYHKIYGAINDNTENIILLDGARGVGKTVIIYQLMADLLGQGLDPRSICYIPFDHPIIRSCDIENILSIYHRDVYYGDDANYMFDEAQLAGEWDIKIQQLKAQKPKARILVARSLSLPLTQPKSTKSQNIWQTINLCPQTFYEYCVSHGQNPLKNRPGIWDIVNSTPLEQMNLFAKLESLEKLFKGYILANGSIKFSSASRDLIHFYNIRNVLEFEQVFAYMCCHSSERLNIYKLINEIGGITRPTAQRYLTHLQQANFVNLAGLMDVNFERVRGSFPKVYVADSGLRYYVLRRCEGQTNEEEINSLIKTSVYNHLLHDRQISDIGYTQEAGRQIDIAIASSNQKFLIDINYSDNFNLSSSLLIRRADIDTRGLLITKNSYDFGRHKANEFVFRIPAYAYLYLVG